MAKKLVVFDLDGTLLDTADDLAHGCEEIMKRHSYPSHSREEYRSFVGNGVKKLVERALPPQCRDENTIERLRDEFVEYYHSHIALHTRPYEGINHLLDTLTAQGVKTAVLSNKYHAGTVKLINIFFPDIPFTHVLGQRDGFPLKPSPAVLNSIMKDNGVTKQETLYVGDTATDMETGISAGVETVGVTWGFRPRKVLEECLPSHIADRASDILLYL